MAPASARPRGTALALFAHVAVALALGAQAPAAAAQQIEQRVAIVAEQIASRVPGFSYRPESTSRLEFKGTALAPRAAGDARVRTTRGRTEVEVDFTRLPDPASLGPFTTYVLWAVTLEGRATNVGVVEVTGERGRIETVTPLSAFALIVTAEPHFAVTIPGMHVVMQGVGAEVQGTPMVVTSLLERADYAKLPPAPKADPKNPVPPYLQMARYALAIANGAAAAELAPTALKRAQEALAAAEAAAVAKRSADRALLPAHAREAIQAAEDARVAAESRRSTADLDAARATIAARDRSLQEAGLREVEAKREADGLRGRVQAFEAAMGDDSRRLRAAAEMLARWLPIEGGEQMLTVPLPGDAFVKGKTELTAPIRERLGVSAGILLGLGRLGVVVSPSLQASEDVRQLGLASQRARAVMEWLASLGLKAVVGPPPPGAIALPEFGPGVELRIVAEVAGTALEAPVAGGPVP